MFTKVLSFILAAAGTVAATIGSQGCMVFVLDEPECPKSLIK